MPFIIDWEDIMKGHNDIYSTKYKTVKEFLFDHYDERKQNLGTWTLEKHFGVSHKTIGDKLKSLGAKVHPPGKRVYKNEYMKKNPETAHYKIYWKRIHGYSWRDIAYEIGYNSPKEMNFARIFPELVCKWKFQCKSIRN